ncbi:MAG TPA: sulfatase [Ilumatobacteraceae bacterium]|nr:sulfatase [Ilumatobacteraceae bacterium]
MNVVVILLDSLNRHGLGCYGGTEWETPNLDRFAQRAVRFTNHHTGSLPCIPARHDLLVGAWDFLWKPWGSIELWEEAITASMRRAGVVTQLITDHPHLFETGGENYHTDFTAWYYLRGHESDAWKTRPDASWIGAPNFGRGHTHYDNSRGYFTDEDDFPGPRTMAAAAHWLGHHAPHHRQAGQRFFLWVDEFDPHEPFDTPEPWASMYDPDWSGPNLIWPPYKVGALADGTLDAREARQIRAQYGGKLAMIDHWLGRVLDQLDATGGWDDTAVVVCTDHGHYLGEPDVHGKDVWGKPSVPVMRTLGHTPLLVWWPGSSLGGGTCDALTTTADIHATLLDAFGITAAHRTHGTSLLPLLRGEATSVRDWVLTGVWGREVHLITNQWRYARGPQGPNTPLSMWSNRWSSMPIPSLPDLRIPPPDDRACLDRMPGSTIPVIRQPFVPGDMLPFWAYAPQYATLLFDRIEDPDETVDRSADRIAADAAELLRVALTEVAAPDDQFVRLALT